MKSAYLFVVFTGLGSSVAAQTDALDPAVITEHLAGRFDAMSSPSPGAVAKATQFTFEASSTGKTGNALVGLQFHDVTASFGFTASVGENGTAMLADLNGLRNKSAGELAIRWSHWTSSENPAAALENACKEHDALTGEHMTDTNCSWLSLKRDRTRAGKALFRRVLRSVDPGNVFFVGGGVTFAPEEFAFVGRTDLAPDTVTHTSWSASATAGWLFTSPTMVAATYTREVTYSPGQAASVCSPLPATGSLACVNRVLGPPADPERRNRLGFEFRHFFGGGLAVSPRVNYDWTEHVTGFELPLFFLRDGEGGLTGGVTIGYRSDTQAVTGSVFVGQLLGLISK